MAGCNYPFCERCTLRDCMMERNHLDRMLKERRKKAGVSCSSCPAKLGITSKKGSGSWICLVHKRKINMDLCLQKCPSWCTAGIPAVDERVMAAGRIVKEIEKTAVRLME